MIPQSSAPARDLISEMQLRGIRLSQNGDRLNVRCPSGVPPSEIREALSSRKQEVIQCLCSREAVRETVYRIGQFWGRKINDDDAAWTWIKSQARHWATINKADEDIDHSIEQGDPIEVVEGYCKTWYRAWEYAIDCYLASLRP